MYAMLFECTSVVNPSEITVLEEANIGNNEFKAVFKSRLQTLNEENLNKRYYDTSIGQLIVEQLRPRAHSRSLLMEVDHPMFVSSDPELLKKRAAVTLIENSGALLRDLYISRNEIIGVVETLSGFKGPDLANLVLRDRVPIGFSLRALGSLTEANGVLKVVPPFKAITYDIVSTPSHASAKIVEFIPESFVDYLPDRQQILCESLDLLRVDDVKISEDKSAVEDYLVSIYEDEFSKIISKYVIFRI